MINSKSENEIFFLIFLNEDERKEKILIGSVRLRPEGSVREGLPLIQGFYGNELGMKREKQDQIAMVRTIFPG